MKTVLQVDSYEGFRGLMRRVRAGKINVLYAGAFANTIAAIMGHYPWVCKRTLFYCVTDYLSRELILAFLSFPKFVRGSESASVAISNFLLDVESHCLSFCVYVSLHAKPL